MTNLEGFDTTGLSPEEKRKKSRERIAQKSNSQAYSNRTNRKSGHPEDTVGSVDKIRERAMQKPVKKTKKKKSPPQK